MRKIEKTDAVVLSSIKYLESSKIISLYTAEHGKVSVIAKGARQKKNKFGAALETMTHIRAHVYYKEGRGLQILGECDIINSFRHVAEDLGKMSVGLAIVELVNLVSHEEEKNLEFFQLLVEILTQLDRATRHPEVLLPYFEIHCASILGFHPSLDHCGSCGNELRTSDATDRNFTVQVGSGGFFCSRCSRGFDTGYRLSAPAFEALLTLIHLSSEQVLKHFPEDKAVYEEVMKLLWTYMRYHIPGIKALRSQKVFGMILQSA